jgi:1,4-dihydroxy-2-naphthoyl-CoA synthase
MSHHYYTVRTRGVCGSSPSTDLRCSTRSMPMQTTNSPLFGTSFAARDDLWVGVITGPGERGFSAGNDLKVQAGGKRRPDRPRFAGICSRFDLANPLIAAVSGVAIGGGFEIAQACDTGSRIAQPPVTK